MILKTIQQPEKMAQCDKDNRYFYIKSFENQSLLVYTKNDKEDIEHIQSFGWLKDVEI